jgi:SAM-dependent methyltransferase
MIATTRTHDNFYLNEDRSQTPKEYFKFLVRLTTERLGGKEPSRMDILDIGCASGDFLYYLRQRFPKATLQGMDVSPSLLSAAQSKVPEAAFRAADINANDFVPPALYDVVYMAGVHSIFDSCERWVKNITSMLTQNGAAYVFGLFNPFPYDVLVYVRKAGDTGPYEPGWNCPSKETVSAEFKKHGWTVDFIGWNVPLDIAMNPQDPLRSWTTPLADGTRLVTNATRIIHDFYCAVITR